MEYMLTQNTYVQKKQFLCVVYACCVFGMSQMQIKVKHLDEEESQLFSCQKKSRQTSLNRFEIVS
jgi:hypothetical protein